MSVRGSFTWFDTESIFQSRLSSEAQMYTVVFVPVICRAAASEKTFLEKMFFYFLFCPR